MLLAAARRLSGMAQDGSAYWRHGTSDYKGKPVAGFVTEDALDESQELIWRSENVDRGVMLLLLLQAHPLS